MRNQREVRHVMSFNFRLSGKSTMCARFWDESEDDAKGARSRSFLVANHDDVSDSTASRDLHLVEIQSRLEDPVQ